jgi:rare lipoprotein A
MALSPAFANVNDEIKLDPSSPPPVAEMIENQDDETEDMQTLDITDDDSELQQWLEDLDAQESPTVYVDEDGNEYYLPSEDVADNSGRRHLRKRGPKAQTRNCIARNGRASWYGPGFNGKKTASGETFNQGAYTAAHKTLKFGTIVKVTFRGRSVKVRINDAGPYHGGRVIDLSKAAAQAIGLIGPGSGSVTLEVISCG